MLTVILGLSSPLVQDRMAMEEPQYSIVGLYLAASPVELTGVAPFDEKAVSEHSIGPGSTNS